MHKEKTKKQKKVLISYWGLQCSLKSMKQRVLPVVAAL